MDEHVMDAFQRMGARVQVRTEPMPKARGRAWNGGRRFTVPASPVTVDVGRDECGEFFTIRRRADVAVAVLDVRPRDQHLLLSARERITGRTPRDVRDQDSRFLCGHDERAWFVAAIPEGADARSVQRAKDALKPPEVWEAMSRYGVPAAHRDRRRTRAFVRQGEWFFIPRPDVSVGEGAVLRNEPILRGGGKPHLCQFLHRVSGEWVYVNEEFPNGLTPNELAALPREKRVQPFERRVRGAHVYVKGAIRHTDHKTVWLQDWHEVVMNTETQARAMAHVAFLD